MPVRRIASINAGCEMKKRKFVSSCFHRANAGWHTGCSAPSACEGKEDQARKADCCQLPLRNNCAPSFVARQIQLAANQRTQDERSDGVAAQGVGEQGRVG